MFNDVEEANLHPFGDEESPGPDQLRHLAVSLRECADAVEGMADKDEDGLIPDLVITSSVVFYTHSAEEFRALVRLLGGRRDKGGYEDAFFVTRRFGSAEDLVTVTIHAPSRESVCEKRVVGTKKVEEQIFVKTGHMIDEEVVEWDCGNLLGEEAA